MARGFLSFEQNFQRYENGSVREVRIFCVARAAAKSLGLEMNRKYAYILLFSVSLMMC